MRPSSSLRYGYYRRFGLAFFLGLLLSASYYVFVCTPLGQAVDTLSMFAFHDLNKSFANWDRYLLQEIYWFLSLPIFALALIVCFYRKRQALLVRIGLMVVLASVATQLLKHYILMRPDLGISFYMENSFPSGHTTIAMSGGAALVTVASPTWRKFMIAISAIYVSIIGVAVMTARWHRLSDVLAAFMVVSVMTLLLAPLERDLRGKQSSRLALPLLLTVGGGLGLAYVFYYLASRSDFVYTTASLESFVQGASAPVVVLVWGSLLSVCGFAWFCLREIGKANLR